MNEETHTFSEHKIFDVDKQLRALVVELRRVNRDVVAFDIAV